MARVARAIHRGVQSVGGFPGKRMEKHEFGKMEVSPALLRFLVGEMARIVTLAPACEG